MHNSSRTRSTIAAFIACSTLLPAASAAVVGFWEFEGSTSAEWLADSSGNGYNLAGAGAGTGFTVTSSAPTGFSGAAAYLNFDSTNVYRLTTADTAAFYTQTMTLEATINLTDASKVTNIIGQGVLNPTGGWGLVVSRTGDTAGSRELRFVYQLVSGSWSTNVITLDSNVSLNLNTTYYVGLSVDLTAPSATGATFYIQDLSGGGSLQTVSVSIGSTGLLNTTDTLAVGFQNSSTQFKGYIDDVRFSNAVLGADQLLIAPIPEPSSAAILAGASALLLVVGRRRGQRRG